MPASSGDWDGTALSGVDVLVSFYMIQPDRTVNSYTPFLRPGLTPELGTVVVAGDEECNRVRGTIVAISPFRPGVDDIVISLDLDTFTSGDVTPDRPADDSRDL